MSNLFITGFSIEEQRQFQNRQQQLDEIGKLDSRLVDLLGELDSLERVLAHLDQTTNDDILMEEIKETRSLWHSVGLYYFYSGLAHSAIAIFHRLYERICQLQEANKRWLAKGLPLIRLADIHSQLGHPAIGMWYLLLTAVSDAIRDEGKVDHKKSGVYTRALQYGWSDEKLKSFYLASHAEYESRNPLRGFPEYILSNLTVPFSIPYATASELDIYEINKLYANRILKSLNASSGDQTGKALERLASYFLSRIPGFEAQTAFQSKDMQYDGFVRNTGPKYDFRADLGFYLLVECKDWKKPIGVPEVSQFINKLVLQDCRGGILFSSHGITGKKTGQFAELQLLKAHYRAGKVILVLNERDFRQVVSGTNLISMLRQKYEEVRFDIPAG